MIDQKDIKIVNLVATSSIGKSVNLSRLADTLPCSEYNLEKFPGLVVRLKVPKVSFLLFGNGNFVCTGAKSEKELHQAITQFNQRVEGIL